MFFQEILGNTEIIREKINFRLAMRAVILNENKILLIKTNKGDFIFPGGGVKSGETYNEALKREVIEESEYIIDTVGENLGTIVERKIDEFDKESMFDMTSMYYLCDLSGEKTSQNLDDYEREQEFSPVWTTIDEALSKNEKIIEDEKDIMNPWVERETLALRKVKEYINQ